MSTPLPRALKQLFPDTELDLVLTPGTAAVYEHNPFVDRVHLFDKTSLLKKTGSFISLVGALRKRNYDLAVSLHVSATSSWLMLLSGAGQRLGFPRQRFTTLSIDLPKGIPVVKRGLLLLQALTDGQFDYQTEMFVAPETQTRVSDFLMSQELDPARLIAVAPGSIWATKRWPEERYAGLVRGLSQAGWTCVLLGSGADKPLCERIIQAAGVRAVNSAGSFDIPGSAELIRHCRLLITNDSAPLHMANAVKTDVLAIFGPTVERFGCFPFRARDQVVEVALDCRPCGKHGHQSCPRGHFRCMREIGCERVLQAALPMLAEPAAGEGA